MRATLFVAWPALFRFRVVLAIRDKTGPSVMAALDVTFRRLGGSPTYVLTDNEKTVTTEHVAGMAVRNPAMVEFARFYGVTVHTCQPCDPASKGGSESSVKIAKADLVPKDTNLLEAYDSFADLEAACEAFCLHVNARVHRVTRRAPAEMLAAEQARLHPVPTHPHTVAFGVTRTVPAKTPLVPSDGRRDSVPSPPPRLPLPIGLICQLPAREAWVLARLSRGPERSVRGYVSTGPQRKRSQNPGSAGVVTN